MVLLLGACTSHSETRQGTSLPHASLPELAAIDSLMWRQPDSALAVLQQFAASPKADSLDEFNEHYCQLLISELLYKNDYGQSNRPALQQTVRYFDSLCLCKGVARNISAIAFLDARAHYINGVGYYERDSAVDACKEYLKALEVMEGHFEEKELVGNKAMFMALTCTRLTDLYADDFLQEQALDFGKLSLKYYQKYDAQPSHIAWVLNELGFIYDIMGQLDSSDYYYSCAVDILPDTINPTYRDITTRQALLSYKKDHQPEKSLALLYRLAQLAESNHELLARYLVIGDIYYYEGHYDSAWVYLKQVYDNTSAPDSKMLATERLQEISIKNGDTLKAREYALARSQYVTAKDEDGKLHSTLTGLCQQYEQIKQETQHRLKVQKATRRWGIVLGIVLALAVVVSVFLTLSRKRNQRLKTEKEDVGRLLETERHAHKMQQSSLSNRLKRSNEELRELKGQIKRQDELKASLKQTESFADEPICRLIMERVNEGKFKSKMDYTFYKDYALDNDQISALHKAADRHFNQFTMRISKAYPELTRLDLDYCCLYLLGLSDSDISALMQRAYNTVNERNSKLRRVFGSENAISITLQAIANESISI